MMVVSVPEPAISGNAIGTMLPLFGLLSCLKKSTPKIISKPMIKITKLPATANDCTSTPSSFKNPSPTNKNKIINAPDAMVACKDCICPPILSFREIKTGIEPRMSITANKVKVMVNNCLSEMLAKLRH